MLIHALGSAIIPPPKLLKAITSFACQLQWSAQHSCRLLQQIDWFGQKELLFPCHHLSPTTPYQGQPYLWPTRTSCSRDSSTFCPHYCEFISCWLPHAKVLSLDKHISELYKHLSKIKCLAHPSVDHQPKQPPPENASSEAEAPLKIVQLTYYFNPTSTKIINSQY